MARRGKAKPATACHPLPPCSLGAMGLGLSWGWFMMVRGGETRCKALCWGGERCKGKCAGGTGFCKNHMRGQPHGLAGEPQIKEEKEEGGNKRRRSSKQGPLTAPTPKQRCTAMTPRGQCINPARVREILSAWLLTLCQLSMRPCSSHHLPPHLSFQQGRLTLTFDRELVLYHFVEKCMGCTVCNLQTGQHSRPW